MALLTVTKCYAKCYSEPAFAGFGKVRNRSLASFLPCQPGSYDLKFEIAVPKIEINTPGDATRLGPLGIAKALLRTGLPAPALSSTDGGKGEGA